MYVITNQDNIVIATGHKLTHDGTESGVIYVDGCGYGVSGQKLEEVASVPSDVISGKYTYSGGKFAPYKSAIDKFSETIRDDYTLKLIEEGVL